MTAFGTANAQVTFTVTNLNDSGTGSLREAIRLSNNTDAADTIEFSIFGTIELESQLPNVRQDLTIDGEGQITLDAGNGVDGLFATGDGYRIFDIDDRSSFSVTPHVVTLIGLTLTGGDTPRNSGSSQQPGGAIRNRERLTLINVRVIANAAGDGGITFSEGGDGGGIFNLAGILTLIDCTVSENKSGDGGSSSGSSDSRGGEGGGIDGTSPGSMTLIRTTVSNNIAGAGGTFNGSPDSGGLGGGISNSATLTMDSCTVSGNMTMGQRGGGIHTANFFDSQTVTITNCTVTGNVATGEGEFGIGGGISTRNDFIRITNSIIAGNSAESGSPDIEAPGYEAVFCLIEETDRTFNPVFGNIVGVSPNLGPLADNGGLTQTHALLDGSPAIDAGDSGVSFDADEFDQRGAPFARVVDGGSGLRIDMGAFELSDDFAVGDVNCDGSIDFDDIGPFITVLASDGFNAKADINGDNAVDFDDIGPFIQLLAAP